ncbi:PIMT1 [Scenedesmus sp. PABB004]|nr:PIMT1 [Scenedesmus sp. PABB004]
MADPREPGLDAEGLADAEEDLAAEEGAEEDLHGNRRRRARAVHAEAIPLEGLLRLLAGQRVVVQRRDAARSNEELVAGLKRAGMLTSEGVARAMLAVPRGAMVPEAYRGEAWVDSPIRVEEDDFNISAPHMHAQMLDSLELAPGDRMLDVGCGCAIISACAALLVGRTGRVVGIDTKPRCVQLSRDNVARLAEANAEFASSAAPLSFFQHNVFIPSPQLKGKFNKVCVGAACPEDRVHLLLTLLEPSGKLLAPVDSDLRLYSRAPDGSVRHSLVSSVRFSELDVPSDATIALAVLGEARRGAMRIDVSPPTLAQDLRDGAGPGCGGLLASVWTSCFSPFGANATPPAPGTSPGSEPLPLPETPVMRGGRTAAPAPAGEDGVAAGAAEAAPTAPAGGAGAGDGPGELWGGLAGLGTPDIELLGQGWRLPAHKAVLRARAAHFAARLSSGMRDAHDASHTAPEGFSLACMKSLLHYMYHDDLPPGLDPPAVVRLLHAACFYGTPRLIELCQESLVAELLRMPPAAAAAEAPHLLALADELGLVALRRAAACYVAQRYADVSRSEAWAGLDRSAVEHVAAHLAGEVTRLTALLKELEPPSGAAAVPKRRAWW